MEFTGATACNYLQRHDRTKPYVLRHFDTFLLLRFVALEFTPSQQKGTTVGPLTNIARLTKGRVDSLRPRDHRYEINDPACAGLQLRIAETGVKSWHWRFYWHGKRARLVLGVWPTVSLTEAHEKSDEARALLRRGIDPRRAGITLAPQVKAETPTAEGPPGHTVARLAREYMTRHVTRLRRRPEYVQRILDSNILPRWANRDARTIKPREVIELLDEIADRAPVMANRVAGILSQMFRFGIHRAIVETSPVQLLYRPGGREKPRTRAFSEIELKAFIKHLDDACRFQRLPPVLRVLLLTLQRRSELALAEWREFNLNDKTWTIPDAHAKAGKGQVLPLSDWAIAEFQKLKVMAGGSRFVLPNADQTAPADPKYITRSVARCLRRFKRHKIDAFTPHDLRRTGRTGLARLGVETGIAERVLNHARERIEATYDVHDYFDEKRKALELWASHLARLRDCPDAEA
jgi:integrase